MLATINFGFLEGHDQRLATLGAQTPTANLKGLRAYPTEADALPVEVLPPAITTASKTPAGRPRSTSTASSKSQGCIEN